MLAEKKFYIFNSFVVSGKSSTSTSSTASSSPSSPASPPSTTSTFGSSSGGGCWGRAVAVVAMWPWGGWTPAAVWACSSAAFAWARRKAASRVRGGVGRGLGSLW